MDFIDLHFRPCPGPQYIGISKLAPILVYMDNYMYNVVLILV